MRFELTDLHRLRDLPVDDIIDVRAPSEFAEDHIPGALSLPVLSDAERAEVGTIYVQEDRFLARKIGAALVAKNAAAHLQGPLADRSGAWRPLVYCWRGGQRSGSFASILDQIGWRVQVLDGGYRSYRRLVVDLLYKVPLPYRFVLIDGGTGTGKTHLLRHLSKKGAQVIDLEGLAQHRGSNFGSLAGGQPAQKGFESQLAQLLVDFSTDKPIFLEGESNAIGSLLIPPTVWAAMGQSEVITVEAPVAARAKHLLTAYPDLTHDLDLLLSRIEALRSYHPRDQIDAWRRLAQDGAYATLAEALIDGHYDPRYRRSLRHRLPLGTVTLEALSEGDMDRAADAILALVPERKAILGSAG
ncbi:MAG: tRNA 2-selenouridine(34) synthase MnmH [Pseudomonadota bacterium]